MISRYLFYFLILIPLASPLSAQTNHKNAPVNLEESIPLTPPSLDAEIIKVSGEYRLAIANEDPLRTFQGLATISFGNQQQQIVANRVKLELAAHESAYYLLYSMPAFGENYTLLITDQSGSIVFHKIAPLKSVDDPTLTAPPPKPLNITPFKDEPVVSPLKVKARLTGGATENDPYLLAFEFSSPTPITSATLQVKAKGLNEMRPLAFAGTTFMEIKLPDDLEVQKISYVVTGSRGENLARGEADLAQLMTVETVNIASIISDKNSYSGGEQAKIIMQFSGNTANGIRIEIVAKDKSDHVIFRDIRKEKRETGLQPQEFVIPISNELKEALIIETKIFEGDSTTLLDSSVKEIPIQTN